MPVVKRISGAAVRVKSLIARRVANGFLAVAPSEVLRKNHLRIEKRGIFSPIRLMAVNCRRVALLIGLMSFRELTE
jgi:hypothetical protein